MIVAAGLYAGWTYFQGRASQPVSIPAATPSSTTIPAPASEPQTAAPPTAMTTAKPVIAAPKPTSTAPSTSPSSSNAQPAVKPPADDAQASDADDSEPVTKSPNSSRGFHETFKLCLGQQAGSGEQV